MSEHPPFQCPPDFGDEDMLTVAEKIRHADLAAELIARCNQEGIFYPEITRVFAAALFLARRWQDGRASA